MPANRNALIRYKTIDLCLQNRYRLWTLDDLIEACTDALYEFEGRYAEVSRRTVQLDLQMMRSDKLGYNAPIIVFDKKYYTYENKEYSITKIPISQSDLNHMSETIDFLKQFKGFTHFRELDSMVQKLEDYVHSNREKMPAVIDFEKNDELVGLQYLDIIYKAIIQKKSILLEYKSFVARNAQSFVFHPFLLKEYRNRWFVIGNKSGNKAILNLALDRIVSIKSSSVAFQSNQSFNPEIFFKDVIGVTVNESANPGKVVLFISRKHAPYVETKPFHHSQQIIERSEYGILISLFVQHNYELEKEILGMGDGVLVIEPDSLKRTILNRINNAKELYYSNKTMFTAGNIYERIENVGYVLLSQFFTTKQIRELGLAVFRNIEFGKYWHDWKPVFERNSYMLSVINQFSEVFLRKVLNENDEWEGRLVEKVTPENMVWHQQKSGWLYIIFFLQHARVEEYKIQIAPQSHRRIWNQDEVALIIENSDKRDLSLQIGDALFYKSSLLIKFDSVFSSKHVRYFEMRLKTEDLK